MTLAGIGGMGQIVARIKPETTAKVVLVTYGVVMLGAFSVGVVAPLHYLYPGLSLLVGAILIRTWPGAYISFTIWLWILSPLLRRVIDYHSYYVNPSPVLLAPVLVVCLTAPRVLVSINERWYKAGWPFLLALGALTWGLVIGLLSNPFLDVVWAFISWSSPICFGLFLKGWWASEGHKIQLLQANMVWAVLLMGAYGIYQFVVAPPWDCAWLENTNEVLGFTDGGSWGRPEPFGIRVWSTLNSPGVFGCVMMCALIMLLSTKHKLRLPAITLGYASFLLSLHRSSWTAYLIGVFCVIIWDRKQRMRYAMTACVTLVVGFLVICMISSDDLISQRMLTFAKLSDDMSLQARLDVHERALAYIAAHPFGTGLTSGLSPEGVLDSGVLTLFILLGWFGALCYFAALAGLFGKAIKRSSNESSGHIACRAVTVSFVVYSCSGDIGYGVQGFFLWTFVALAFPKKFSLAASVKSLPPGLVEVEESEMRIKKEASGVRHVMSNGAESRTAVLDSVAVLICTYNRHKDLVRCLDALTRQTRRPDDVIIVVRDADLATQQVIATFEKQRLSLRLVLVNTPGLVFARNAGLDICTSDIVAMIDDDTVPYFDWLARIVEHFRRDPTLGGVGGRDRCGDGVQFDERRKEGVGKLHWYGRLDGYHNLGYGACRKVDHLKGANMAYRVSAIAKTRFDARLRGEGAQPFEDTAFSLAVRRNGWKLVYDPQVLVDHVEGARDEIRYYTYTLPVKDVDGFENMAFNNAVALWGNLSSARMLAFSVWSFGIGVRICPGMIQAIRFTPQMGLLASWRRFYIAQRGFAKAYWNLLRQRRRTTYR